MILTDRNLYWDNNNRDTDDDVRDRFKVIYLLNSERKKRINSNYIQMEGQPSSFKILPRTTDAAEFTPQEKMLDLDLIGIKLTMEW